MVKVELISQNKKHGKLGPKDTVISGYMKRFPPAISSSSH